MKIKTKKGQVMENIGALGVGIATFTIVIVIAFLVMANVKTQEISTNACTRTNLTYNSTLNICCNTINCGAAGPVSCNATSAPTCLSLSMNATQDLQEATATIPGWVPLIILVAIGGIILSLVAVFKR